MISHPETERVSKVLTASGVVAASGVTVSAILLDGGTAATGATVILDDSSDGTGTAKWIIRSNQYSSIPMFFPKPIPFVNGCYATLTGTAMKLAIAYT